MAKPIRGLNVGRRGAAAAAEAQTTVSARTTASAPAAAIRRSTLPARIGRHPIARRRPGTALGAATDAVSIASPPRLSKPGGLAGTPAEIAPPACDAARR